MIIIIKLLATILGFAIGIHFGIILFELLFSGGKPIATYFRETCPKDTHRD